MVEHKNKYPGKNKSAAAPANSLDRVRAKKHLGQHFLKDENVSKKIAHTLDGEGYNYLLEIGPGMGVLTKYLLQRDVEVHVIEIDPESVHYLQHHYPDLKGRVHQEDFLSFDVLSLFKGAQFGIIGNFPYNISSQIVFKMLDLRDHVPEFAGMFQKEVAQRICEQKGSKTYGILSVLVQAFYQAEYLFTVPPSVFIPPPKVDSGVLRLTRKKDYKLPCDEGLFFKVVKAAFQQRRKTIWNSLKRFELPDHLKEEAIFGRRPEQLSTAEFISLTQKIAPHAVSNK